MTRTPDLADDIWEKERRHVELKTPAASILREGCAHRAGLGLRLELTDQLCVPLGFPVYGVLEPLYEPLQVRDARFE